MKVNLVKMSKQLVWDMDCLIFLPDEILYGKFHFILLN